MSKPEYNCVYDAKSLFPRHRTCKYQVSIDVTPTFAFFLTVVKCMFLNTNLRILNTFSEYPFLTIHQIEDSDERGIITGSTEGRK
jgi:hypothetical protein